MAMHFIIPLTIGLTLIVTFASAQKVRLSEVDRQTALSHLRAGQEALAGERFDDAEREFGEAIRLDPRLELAHYGLGQVFMATRRYEHAVGTFVNCRDVFRGNVSEDQSARLTFERRLDDQIQSKRDELLALQTGRVRSSSPMGIDRVRSELTQLERLRGRSRESVGAMTPPFILTALGSAYFRTGAFADAEREWRAALAVDPAIGEVHNNLAVIYLLTGRYDQADEAIRRAEKAGFKVNPQLKDDLKKRRGGSS
jgi:tetratricopeptide (TPR) repeat protein